MLTKIQARWFSLVIVETPTVRVSQKSARIDDLQYNDVKNKILQKQNSAKWLMLKEEFSSLC